MNYVLGYLALVIFVAAPIFWLGWLWVHKWEDHAWEPNPSRAYWRIVWRRVTFRE